MKWYWTPYGWLRAFIAIGLLLGAAFIQGWLSSVMIAIALILGIYSYIKTYQNIKKSQGGKGNA